MGGDRFNALAQLLTDGPSRRDVLRGLAATGLGLGIARHQEAGEAKKKRKHKTKKPKPNAFGCLDVGQPCAGNSATCCSGVCDGVKPKKGKKDTSRCVAHNAGICGADSNICTAAIQCNPSSNPLCGCALTTGNAGICGDFTAGATALCRFCTKDTDCQVEFGPGAACIVLEGACETFCAATGRTACVPPCA